MAGRGHSSDEVTSLADAELAVRHAHPAQSSAASCIANTCRICSLQHRDSSQGVEFAVRIIRQGANAAEYFERTQ
jgi:hypothetical protein